MIAQRFRFLHSAITIDAPINLQRNAALFLRTPGYRDPDRIDAHFDDSHGLPVPLPPSSSPPAALFLSPIPPSPLDPSHVVAGCKSAGQVWKEKRTAGGGGQGREARTGGWVGRRGQEEEEDEGVGIRSRTRANSSHGSRESARFRRHAWADQQITPVLYF